MDPSAPMDDNDNEPALDPEALERQRVLGDRLRSLFDDVIKEDIPDEFTALLAQLDDQEES